jgi:hypothetical protein
MKAYTNVAQLLKSRENAVDMSTCRKFYQMQQAVARTFQGKEWSWEGEALTKLAMRHDGATIWTFIAIVQPKSHFHSPWFSNGGYSQYFTK